MAYQLNTSKIKVLAVGIGDAGNAEARLLNMES